MPARSVAIHVPREVSVLIVLSLLACVHQTPADPPSAAVAVAPAPVEQAAPALVAHAADPTLDALLAAARADTLGWERLAWLCDRIGPRLSGTEPLEQAVVWAKDTFTKDGHSAVRLEPVMVPHWVRGPAALTLLSPRRESMAVLALGSSVSAKKLEAPVALVEKEEDIGPQLLGHIALFNIPMTDGVPTGPHYGEAVRWRASGATVAAQQGAVGALVRSVTTRSLYTPHTGFQRYGEDVTKVPAASITAEDADYLARLIKAGVDVRVSLDLDAQTLPEVESHNVLAEITGSEFPGEIVLIGAHLDSWDVGQGAHDDGAGVVEVIEALRLIRASGVQPRRTIRAVLFTAEEPGVYGGRAYAPAHAAERHVAAIESDIGGGMPLRWGAEASEGGMSWLRDVAAPLGLPVTEGGGGADIDGLRAQGTVLIGLGADDSHYFDIHHTEADTLDKVDPAALREATAAMAGLAWLLANADAPPQESAVTPP